MNRDGLERCRWVDSIDDFVRQHGRATPRWAIGLLPTSRPCRPWREPSCRRRLEGGDAFGLWSWPTRAHSKRHYRWSRPCCRIVEPVPGTLQARRGVPSEAGLPSRREPCPRACFGSANVTDGGVGTNLELWTHTESPELLAGIQRFVGALATNRDLAIDDGARRNTTADRTAGSPWTPTPSVGSSATTSSRLRVGPEKRAQRVSVVSPMYASVGGVRAARRALPAGSVNLFTTANVVVPASKVFVYDPPHPADSAEDDAEAFQRTLHAKAYVFHLAGRGEAIAWTGSANFTAQALTKPVARGGNVELMVRGTLPADEADALEVDLKYLFKASKGASAPEQLDTSALPRPAATVLAGEIVGTADDCRLVVHAHRDRQGRARARRAAGAGHDSAAGAAP